MTKTSQYDKDFVIARICKAWACKFVAIHRVKFAFKFIDCHARLVARSQWRAKGVFAAQWWRGLLSYWAFCKKRRPNGLQSVATAKKSTCKNGKALSFWVSETSEKSTEFKTHFKFLDTSLHSVWQWKWFGMTRQVSMTEFWSFAWILIISARFLACCAVFCENGSQWRVGVNLLHYFCSQWRIMADKIFVILSFVLFVKTIERALCVFKDLQKRFKEPYVLFFRACKQKI